MTPEQLSIRLYGLMRHLGLKKKGDLAKKLGYSRTQIYMLENGDSEPTARFWSELERLERESGYTAAAGSLPSEQERTSDQSGRLREDPPAPCNDAEINGLAALLVHHAARLTAGETLSPDLPYVRGALELALQGRGVLPKP